MGFPKIDIQFQNGALKSFVSSPDGVFGMICQAVAVGDTFEINKTYTVKGMADVLALGIVDDVNNHVLYKFFNEFYAEAGEGAEISFRGTDRTENLSASFINGGDGRLVDQLCDDMNNKLRCLFVVFNPDDVLAVQDGLAEEVETVKGLAQSFAEYRTNEKYAPLFVIIDGYGFSGVSAELLDLTEDDKNRVGILIGDTETRTGETTSKGSAIGLLAGRLAKNQVHVNIGRVRDGSINASKLYVLDKAVENYDTEALHDKGYLTFRQHVSRAGYFFVDDPLATSVSDDYHDITRRRVIDKAYRIAYQELLDFLLDDFNVNSDGTLSKIDAKVIEGRVISAIYNQMTLQGELSYNPTDPNDKGVICTIDLTHNVTSTSKIKLSALQVRSKAYGRYIDVPLGFIPVSTNS